MRFRRGEVRLANLNPSRGTESGKTRPCLILQSNDLNDAGHGSTIILPLTTQVVSHAAPLRFHLAAREHLKSDSDIMIDQIRTIDNRRFTGAPLTVLSMTELAEIEEYLRILLGFSYD